MNGISSSEGAPTSVQATDEVTTGFMHIGEVAARTDLSLRSLRHWEEVGLLVPSGRTDGGFRLYTETDVEKILVIRRMKPLGFSLEEMKAAMTDIEALRDAEVSSQVRDEARSRLKAVQEDAGKRRLKLVQHLEMADEFIGLLKQETQPS
ncbi:MULTISPECIES: MerR family transcriptional regulator [unclassified Nocardioides]|uniref:MerR family transcriptional regulator n=1 Tax=unclassified Nocardioides TaxID=2615069 RepID=UPI0030157817